MVWTKLLIDVEGMIGSGDMLIPICRVAIGCLCKVLEWVVCLTLVVAVVVLLVLHRENCELAQSLKKLLKTNIQHLHFFFTLTVHQCYSVLQ